MNLARGRRRTEAFQYASTQFAWEGPYPRFRDSSGGIRVETSRLAEGLSQLASPIKVLLADDLPQIRAVLRRVLEKDGRFEIVGEANDGADAVQKVWSLRPDAVVLDLAMPGMDGVEAIPKILETAPGTKIVVLSGFVEMAHEVLKAGAHGFFEKTAPPQELAATIADLVARDD